MSGKYKVYVGGSGFIVARTDKGESLANARKTAIAFASVMPTSRAGRRPVGATVLDGGNRVVGFFFPLSNGNVAEYGSEFEAIEDSMYYGTEPQKQHAALKNADGILPAPVMDALYQIAGRKRRSSARSSTKATTPVKKATTRRAPAKKAPAPQKSPTRKTAKKRMSRASGPMKTFWWTKSDGSYGTVKAASVAEAKRKKRGAKIHTKAPYQWM